LRRFEETYGLLLQGFSVPRRKLLKFRKSVLFRSTDRGCGKFLLNDGNLSTDFGVSEARKSTVIAIGGHGKLKYRTLYSLKWNSLNTEWALY
jgi:hypothetical protein